MIKEVVKYFFDMKIQPQLLDLVSKDEFKETVSKKIDFAIFNQYMKKIMEKESTEKNDF